MGAYAVINPATGETVARFPEATAVEISTTLSNADRSYRQWARTTTLTERVSLAQRAAELHRERAEELAATITQEMGKPRDQALGEVESSAQKIEAFTANAEEWLADEVLSVADGLRTVVKKQGIGVILGIMPWNFPVSQVARFAAANLILGNTVICKLTNQCPQTALAVEQIYRDAGFPEGAYANVFASHTQIAEIIADDRVQGVSLTGSETAGTIIAEQAGRHLKKCVLELGGSDPFIVLDTADVDHAVAHAVAGRMDNSGQACNGSKRIIVVDNVYEEFETKFAEAMAAQSYEDGDYGPLASTSATKELKAQVRTALDQGASLLVGDDSPTGNVFTPTVLTGITSNMDAFREEFFGPVAQLYRVQDADEAVELANASPYGLGAVVIGDDEAVVAEVGDRLDVGMVFIGAAGLEAGDVPFGGVKRSGYGRELGRFGLEEFANRKIFRFAQSGSQD